MQDHLLRGWKLASRLTSALLHRSVAISAAGSGSTSVSFPRDFSQQCWNVQVTVQGSSGSSYTVWTSAPSTTGCTIGAAGQNGLITLYWTAIGI
ncbi:MAG: gp53-like domain-containing protein [Steroidobacteraceae bacterium]